MSTAQPEHARALAEHILSMDLATEKGQHARHLARTVLEGKDESPAELALRSLASWLGCGGYNATAIDTAVMEQRIRNAVGLMQEPKPPVTLDNLPPLPREDAYIAMTPLGSIVVPPSSMARYSGYKVFTSADMRAYALAAIAKADGDAVGGKLEGAK